MAEYFSNADARYPADRVSYKTEKVIKADYSSGTLDVLTDDGLINGLNVSYECPLGGHGSYAFSPFDDVMVRYFDGEPQYAAGFKNELWACIPMPSMTLTTSDKAYSRSMFSETEFVKADLSLFNKRYSEITKKSCNTWFTVYVNTTAPDMSGQFIDLETDTSNPPARDVTMYYDGSPIYHTYNSDPNNIFNGTRSNVLGAFIHPVTKTGIFVYQINTFTDWLPRVSGQVDMDFYIYSSSGIHQKLCSASCTVTGADSPANGECISDVNGFWCDDADTGYIFQCSVNISRTTTFDADKTTNVVNHGDRTRDVTLTFYQTESGLMSSLSGYMTDTYGRISYPDGIVDYPLQKFFKKRR